MIFEFLSLADFLDHILTNESDLDSSADCFLDAEVAEEDSIDTSVDEEDEAEATKAAASYRKSLPPSFAVASTPSSSSGMDSDFSEDAPLEDTEEGRDSQPKPRKKPKKKSRSLLGVERFSLLFKTPRSPSLPRRVQSMGFQGDVSKEPRRAAPQLKHSRSLCSQVRPAHAATALRDRLAPQKHMCMRRRPILSCDEGEAADVPTLVRVVVLGGDREAGRLARAYSHLQQKESRCPRLTKACKLQFYFVPTKRRAAGGVTGCEGQTGGKAAASSGVRTHQLCSHPSLVLHT